MSTHKKFTFEQINREYKHDEADERMVRKHFGLMKYSDNPTAAFDAIHKSGDNLEIKMPGDNLGKGVSTSRNCNMGHTDDKWLTTHWLIGLGKKTKTIESGMIYYLNPMAIRPWVEEQHRKLLYLQSIIDHIIEHVTFPNHMLSGWRLIRARGVTLNDPKIPFTFIKQNGIIVRSEQELDDQHGRFVQRYPTFYSDYGKKESNMFQKYRNQPQPVHD